MLCELHNQRVQKEIVKKKQFDIMIEKRKKAEMKLIKYMLKEKRIPPITLKINGHKIPLYYCADHYHFEKACTKDDLEAFVQGSYQNKMKRSEFKNKKCKRSNRRK